MSADWYRGRFNTTARVERGEGGFLGGLVWNDTMSGICHKTFQRKLRNRLIIIITEVDDGCKWVVISFFVLLYLLRNFQNKKLKKKKRGTG